MDNVIDNKPKGLSRIMEWGLPRKMKGRRDQMKYWEELQLTEEADNAINLEMRENYASWIRNRTRFILSILGSILVITLVLFLAFGPITAIINSSPEQAINLNTTHSPPPEQTITTTEYFLKQQNSIDTNLGRTGSTQSPDPPISTRTTSTQRSDEDVEEDVFTTTPANAGTTQQLSTTPTTVINNQQSDSQSAAKYLQHNFREDYPADCNAKTMEEHQGVSIKALICPAWNFTIVEISRFQNTRLLQDALAKADIAILKPETLCQNLIGPQKLANLELPNLKYLMIENEHERTCTEFLEVVATWKTSLQTLSLEKMAVLVDNTETVKTFFRNFPDIHTLFLTNIVICPKCNPFGEIRFERLEKADIRVNAIDSAWHNSHMCHKLIVLISNAPKLSFLISDVTWAYEDLQQILNKCPNLERAKVKVGISRPQLNLFPFSKFSELEDLLLTVVLKDDIAGPVEVTGFESFFQKHFNLEIVSQTNFQFLLSSLYLEEFATVVRISSDKQIIVWKSRGPS